MSVVVSVALKLLFPYPLSRFFLPGRVNDFQYDHHENQAGDAVSQQGRRLDHPDNVQREQAQGQQQAEELLAEILFTPVG